MKYDKNLNDFVYETEAEICKDALQVQDGSNIVGVMASYRSAVRYLREKNGPEYKYGDHPAVVLFHDKLEDMLRMPGAERTTRYSWAYEECGKLASA